MRNLTPKDIDKIKLYNDWEKKEKIIINDFEINIQKGTITQEGYKKEKCEFSKLCKIMSLDEIKSILKLAKKVDFDKDPDSVDGMCSHEFYIKSPDLSNEINGKYNFSANAKNIRKELKNIINPIIETRINPYVRMLYSKHVEPERQCTPCYCFIRRYKPDERITHATHRDGHAYATVVISLSNYEEEYRGGIYVATSEREKNYIGLNRGDGIVHKHDLLHGVNVVNDGGERWSLIIWYKDSTKCIDYSNNWYKEKAYAGEAVYQSLYANQVGGNEIITWHKKAADQGLSSSMVKLARAYLKKLPSNLEYCPEKAEEYYNLAIKTSQDPHAQYGLAEMMLGGLINIKNTSMLTLLNKVINLLEESAKGGNVFAMFNLGIAHVYGYTGTVNLELAKDWFEFTNLPEGLMAASLYYEGIKDTNMVNLLRSRACQLGFGSEWRQLSRKHTGLGGAGGVDINLPWPQLPNGIKPEIW